MNIPMSKYIPGRFEYLFKHQFPEQIWSFLTEESQIQQMILATRSGQLAITPLLQELENRFGAYLGSSEFPFEDVAVLVNNMIKQIMEILGYEHSACGLCKGAAFIKSSGLYIDLKSS